MHLTRQNHPTRNLFCFNDLESTGRNYNGRFAVTYNLSSRYILQLRISIYKFGDLYLCQTIDLATIFTHARVLAVLGCCGGHRCSRCSWVWKGAGMGVPGGANCICEGANCL